MKNSGVYKVFVQSLLSVKLRFALPDLHIELGRLHVTFRTLHVTFRTFCTSHLGRYTSHLGRFARHRDVLKPSQDKECDVIFQLFCFSSLYSLEILSVLRTLFNYVIIILT